ncbi:MAG: Uma2 family endonuclease [Acidobacteriota bacterium]
MPIPQTNPPRLARENLPTMYDLPSEEIGDAGMPDEFHAPQAYLLDQTFRPPAISPDNYYKAVDMNLYYDVDHTSWYKRPDWFAAIGVPRFYEGRDSRLSYVAWQEPAPPLIIVELLSKSSATADVIGFRKRGLDLGSGADAIRAWIVSGCDGLTPPETGYRLMRNWRIRSVEKKMPPSCAKPNSESNQNKKAHAQNKKAHAPIRKGNVPSKPSKRPSKSASERLIWRNSCGSLGTIPTGFETQALFVWNQDA